MPTNIAMLVVFTEVILITATLTSLARSTGKTAPFPLRLVAYFAALLVISGCHKKPPEAHLVMPPDCVKVQSPLVLDQFGKIIPKQKVTFQINPDCKTEVQKR